jgi:hypothetical protein
MCDRGIGATTYMPPPSVAEVSVKPELLDNVDTRVIRFLTNAALPPGFRAALGYYTINEDDGKSNQEDDM